MVFLRIAKGTQDETQTEGQKQVEYDFFHDVRFVD